MLALAVPMEMTTARELEVIRKLDGRRLIIMLSTLVSLLAREEDKSLAAGTAASHA